MWTLINIEITFQSKCRNFKLDFSKDFKTFIEVLPATLFLPPINLSDLKKRKKRKNPSNFPELFSGKVSPTTIIQTLLTWWEMSGGKNLEGRFRVKSFI